MILQTNQTLNIECNLDDLVYPGGLTKLAAFHQRCDNRGPTVSVGYNASDHVFGGYTKQPFSQSGQYVKDDQAFLFTFSGEKLLKYPVCDS